MEGLSIIIPVYNKVDTTVKCVKSIFEYNKDCAFEIIIVDNGSTDGTQEVFSNNTLPFVPSHQGRGDINPKESGQTIPSPLVGEGKGEGGFLNNIIYIRNPENFGVSKALNIGAGAARYDVLCFMHNDVFVLQERWTDSIRKFIKGTSDAGVVGLYGAKTIRKDGSFRGKSIVHAKKGGPSMTRSHEKVAVVDGLLQAINKNVYDKCRGFCDGFIMHFYDKDISLRAYKNGFINYVLNIPFEHVTGATRGQIAQDESIRNEAQENFMQVWSFYLPVDMSSWRDKISYAVKKKKDS